ncbi:glutathione S-transferase [Epithele typhae]|uniref:glutathione S-transferase n=1 Tax=Epithele typhae TaxID=378194 RepID=UPI0020075C51|nr:glutathione S-transferase [Epithele typhae]KAH9917909.1 glutathione S-transferase [Epithele typhae]
MSHDKQFTLHTTFAAPLTAAPPNRKVAMVLEELGLTWPHLGVQVRHRTVTDDGDRYKMIQWLFFQASGQGPYFGQAFWFSHLHAEKLPSAIERHVNETKHIFGVLDGVLATQEWLVARRQVHGRGHDVDVEKEYPAFFAWHQKLVARPSIAKTLEEQAKMLSAWARHVVHTQERNSGMARPGSSGELKLSSLLAATALITTGVHAGPALYGVCQTGCNAVTVACYAGAGFTFGTVVGAGAPQAVAACSAAQGKCSSACAAVTLFAPTP